MPFLFVICVAGDLGVFSAGLRTYVSIIGIIPQVHHYLYKFRITHCGSVGSVKQGRHHRTTLPTFPTTILSHHHRNKSCLLPETRRTINVVAAHTINICQICRVYFTGYILGWKNFVNSWPLHRECHIFFYESICLTGTKMSLLIPFSQVLDFGVTRYVLFCSIVLFCSYFE